MCPDVYLPFSQRIKRFPVAVLLSASRRRRTKSVSIRAFKSKIDSAASGFSYGYWTEEKPDFLGIVEASFEKSDLNLSCLEPLYTCLVHDGVCSKARWTPRGSSWWHVGHYWVSDWRKREHYRCRHQLICPGFQRHATKNLGERLPDLTRKQRAIKKTRSRRAARVQRRTDVLDETDLKPSIKWKLQGKNDVGLFWKWAKTGCRRSGGVIS